MKIIFALSILLISIFFIFFHHPQIENFDNNIDKKLSAISSDIKKSSQKNLSNLKSNVESMGKSLDSGAKKVVNKVDFEKQIKENAAEINLVKAQVNAANVQIENIKSDLADLKNKLGPVLKTADQVKDQINQQSKALQK